jgi:type I restriction enzyme S subunit
MQIAKGYKQTEVGVIPEDWKVAPLSLALKSGQLGGNYKNSESGRGHPLIKMGNLGRSKISLKKIAFIERERDSDIRDQLTDGDVLFNTRNTLDLVGKVSIWRNELPEAYFNSNIMRMKFDDRIIFSNSLMNYLLNTQKSIRFLRGIAIGTTSVAAIYSRDFGAVKLPLPPSKAEQEAIAEALSDADSLIESLQQLIAKKRQIKQGAMQELLHPKDDWVEKTLGELAENKKARFDDGDWIEKEHITTEGVRLIQTGNIGKGNNCPHTFIVFVYYRLPPGHQIFTA